MEAKTTKPVALFSREELTSIELPREEFVVPGYGKAVEIGPLNSKETSLYQSQIFQLDMDVETGKVTSKPTMEDHEILLVTYGMKNPKLNRDEVGRLPADFVSKVAERIRTISKIDLTVEEAEGN